MFTRNEYKDILLDSLRYCQKEKGMELYAWCIMSNHIHLIFSSVKEEKPELILGSFKRFTSKAIVAAIKENPRESRKEWLLEKFEEAGRKSSNVKQHQLWRHDNKPIELWSNKVIDEKLNYIHNNPLESGFVADTIDWKYSSARNYVNKDQTILEIDMN